MSVDAWEWGLVHSTGEWYWCSRMNGVDASDRRATIEAGWRCGMGNMVSSRVVDWRLDLCLGCGRSASRDGWRSLIVHEA